MIFEKEPYILNGYVDIWNGFDFEVNMTFDINYESIWNVKEPTV